MGEDIIAQMMAQTEEYIKNLEATITTLKESKPTDRLGYATEVNRLINTGMICLKGFHSWFSNLIQIDVLTLEEHKKIYLRMKRTVLLLLEFDLTISKQKYGEAEEKLKVKVIVPEKTKEIQEKEKYIA
jgi:hypothetical protein